MANVPLRARPRTEAIEIGLTADARASIAEGLQSILGATFRLMVRTQIHHWNVVGAVFHPLHVMTEEQYRDMFEAIDAVAERIRALGYRAPGTYGEFVKLSSIAEDGEVGAGDWREMVRQLVVGNEAVCRTARKVLKTADGAGDDPTVDLMTQRLNIHEKNAWMLRSLLA